MKPCPFCGGVDIGFYFYDYGGVSAECKQCNALGPPCPVDVYPYTEAQKHAAVLWNQRAPSLLGRPIIESDELVTCPIIVGGHLLAPGETIAEVLDRMETAEDISQRIEEISTWSYQTREGLPTTLYHALLRGGYGKGKVLENNRLGPPLDRDKIGKAVDNGSIFACRLVGDRSVAVLKQWLATKPPP